MARKPQDPDTSRIAAMDRQALMQAILTIKCDFPVDLTEGFLRPLPLDKLRHIYAALLLRARQPGRQAAPGDHS